MNEMIAYEITWIHVTWPFASITCCYRDHLHCCCTLLRETILRSMTHSL